jgi:hypothetical protein
MPVVLGPTSDMPFVGGRTRPREEQAQEERAAKVSISRIFDGGGSDHYVSRRRGCHDVDVRRDREERGKHGGAGMVGRNDQGGGGGDERDGMVVLSMGRTGGRVDSQGGKQFDRSTCVVRG